MRRINCFVLQPLSRNSTASQSYSFGREGSSSEAALDSGTDDRYHHSFSFFIGEAVKHPMGSNVKAVVDDRRCCVRILIEIVHL